MEMKQFTVDKNKIEFSRKAIKSYISQSWLALQVCISILSGWGPVKRNVSESLQCDIFEQLKHTKIYILNLR